MTIEIDEPRVEALLQRWMNTGRFASLEEAIATALQTAPEPAPSAGTPLQPPQEQTGLQLYEALRRCPYPDVDLEPERFVMPIRDLNW